MEFDSVNAITTLVEVMLPRGQRDKALIVSLDTEGLGERNARRFVQLFFYRPNNYTMVGMKINVTARTQSTPNDFRFLCSHDSGWRSDGVAFGLSQVEIELRDSAGKKEKVRIHGSFWRNPEVVDVTDVTVTKDDPSLIRITYA